MKIELIGTGSIWSTSNSACTLINNNILVDIPNGACKALIKMGHSLEDIDCCIITHLHGDHYFDFPFLLKYQLNNIGKRSTPFIIIGEKEIEESIKKLVELAFRRNYTKMFENLQLKFIDAENLNSFQLYNDIKITSYGVEHSGKYNSYGYLMASNEINVGFTGDSRICNGVYELFDKSDILIADTSLLNGDDSHMGLDDILALSEKNTSKTIIATHMRDNTRLVAEKIDNKNIIIPTDGFSLELGKVVK